MTEEAQTTTVRGRASSAIPVQTIIEARTTPTVRTLLVDQVKVALKFEAIMPPKEARLSVRGSLLKDGPRLAAWQTGYRAGLVRAIELLEERTETDGNNKTE